MPNSRECLSLKNVKAQMAHTTAPSEGSVLPVVALPAHRLCLLLPIAGAGGSGGPAGPFPFFPPHLQACASRQPAVWQTFLGLLIDIQEWNSSRLGRPDRAGTQALCLGNSAHIGKA